MIKLKYIGTEEISFIIIACFWNIDDDVMNDMPKNYFYKNIS